MTEIAVIYAALPFVSFIGPPIGGGIKNIDEKILMLTIVLDSVHYDCR